MKVVGECKQCGACCAVGIEWITCDVLELDDYLAYARARGLRIRQWGRSHNLQYAIIQAEFDQLCPNLDEENHCRLHGHSKPVICEQYPVSDLDKVWKFDMNQVLAPGCGFHFEEDQ